MRILFLSDVPFRHPASGSEQVLHHQAYGLAGRGNEVSAITRMYGREPIVYNGTGGIAEGVYFADPQNPIRFLGAVIKHPSELLQHPALSNPYDVIVSHQPFTQAALSFRRAMPARPIIYVYHSPSHEEYRLQTINSPSLLNLFLKHIRRQVERCCVKRASRIVVLSRYMAAKLQQIHKINRSKIEINPGGVDLNTFTPFSARDRIKADMQYPVGFIHLLTIRNLDPRMGIENLIAAMKLLTDAGLNLHLTIGGSGPEKVALEAMVHRIELDSAVRFVGYIPADKMAAYYNGADFFVLPTKHLEGFGLVTPESMACGTPVLGTPVGGTREILSGFDRRFLFAGRSPEAISRGIKSAIDRYYYNKSAYRVLRLKCREYIQDNYSWDRHVKVLETILTKVVSNA